MRPTAPLEIVWDDDNLAAAFAPINRRGADPLAISASIGGLPADDRAAGARSFQFQVPLVTLPGRGPDLSLTLFYDSHVWTKFTNDIYEDERLIFAYDVDRDWPAPGWHLGFGTLVLLKSLRAVLVSADGARHALKDSVRTRAFFQGHTDDGTLIDCYLTTPDDAPASADVRYPDGSRIEFAARGIDTLYPVRIADANGNYIRIEYRNGRGPQIDHIVDTLGRIVRFHYDGNGLLTAITVPGLGEPNGSVTERTVVRMHYRQLTLRRAGAFVEGARVDIPKSALPHVWVVDGLYWPGLSQGYWFGDDDSYSPYGMLSTVERHRGMTLVATGPRDDGEDIPAPLDDMGELRSGEMVWQERYDYPRELQLLDDMPAYTSRIVQWLGMNTEPAHTRYEQPATQGVRQLRVTKPDGVTVVEHAYDVDASIGNESFKQGLVFRVEVYRGTDLLRSTEVEWEPSEWGPRQRRVAQTNERGPLTSVVSSYGPYNQLLETRSSDFGDTPVLRTVRTTYASQPEYVTVHIFNLPTRVETFDQWGVRCSCVEYGYDEWALASTPGVVNQFVEWDPDRGEYSPLSQRRGLVTTVTTYADAPNLAQAVVERRAYDLTGNLLSTSVTSDSETRHTYAAETQYAYPTARIRGAMDPMSPARVTETAKYDFNTGLQLSSTDANGRMTTYRYDTESLRPMQVTLSTGATTGYAYDDTSVPAPAAAMVLVTTRLSEQEGASIASQQKRFLDGAGNLCREATLDEGGSWNIVETQCDAQGRLWKRSRPYRLGQMPQWSERLYDGLSRVVTVRAPDGSEVRSFYNETSRPAVASVAPGETVRVRDGWGREKWSRTDALGRLVEVIEPDPSGDGSVLSTGGLQTMYSYDGAGNLTQIHQGSQFRVFEYDSLGRLVRQKLPEKLGTLDSNGRYLGYSGLWSDVFSYDVRSNLTSHIDARGIKTAFAYHADPLDRLQEVSYTTDAPADAPRVVPVARTAYSYVAVGDVTRVARETTDGVAAETYEYDNDGRVATKTLVFAERDEYPLALAFAYDSLNRWLMMTYPAFYRYEPGGASQPNPNARRRRRLFQSYDVAGRIKQLQARVLTSSSVVPDDYATDLCYNAAGQVTRLVVGASQEGVAETYEYEDSTGFLARQQVGRHDTPILALSYRYERPNLPGRTGQLTRVEDGIDPRRTRDYVYDAVGRLVRATAGDRSTTQWTQMYRYDAFGNRAQVEASAVTGSPLYDGQSALQFNSSSNRVATLGYLYDAAGNQTRAQGKGSAWLEYEYDAAGRLVRVVGEARNTLERYGYGADRRRLFTEDGATGVQTYYVWHDGAVIAEYRERPSTPRKLDWWKSNYYLTTRLLCTASAESAAKGLEFCHPDQVSTRLVTRSIDHNIYTQTTLPFGTMSASESTGLSTRPFMTYERNATGLDYAVNRYYDPLQGRFIQVDPLGVGASQIANPQSLNLYVYVANDPVNRIDPAGLIWRAVAGGSETGVMVDYSDLMGRNYFGETGLASPGTYAGIVLFGKQGPVIRSSDMQFASMRQGFFTTEQVTTRFVAGYEWNPATNEFYHVARARAELARLMEGAVASKDSIANVTADWLEKNTPRLAPSAWTSLTSIGPVGVAATATTEVTIAGVQGLLMTQMPVGLLLAGAAGPSIAFGSASAVLSSLAFGYGIGSFMNYGITNWLGTPGKPLGASVYDWLYPNK